MKEINQPTREEPEQIYSGIPTNQSKEMQPSTEQLQLKLPNGFECMLGSSLFNVYQLADLVLQLKKEFDNGATKKETSMVG